MKKTENVCKRALVKKFSDSSLRGRCRMCVGCRVWLRERSLSLSFFSFPSSLELSRRRFGGKIKILSSIASSHSISSVIQRFAGDFMPKSKTSGWLWSLDIDLIDLFLAPLVDCPNRNPLGRRFKSKQCICFSSV